MSHRNLRTIRYASYPAFTLVEIVIGMTVVAILSVAFITVFSSTLNQYFDLQEDGTHFTDLASQSERITNVLRGATDITTATSQEIQVYAYFAPQDTYVSQIRYYRTADNKKLLADVTRMTENPPTGTPIPSSLKTYTVLGNYYQAPGVNLFTYLDASGNPLPMPITDLSTIKGIEVSLAVPSTNPSAQQAVTIQVSLRNRKTNL